MASKELFLQAVQQGYTFKGESFRLGVGMFDKQVVQGAEVLLPLKTMNRHGLIAGATGTGKTKTLQVLKKAMALFCADAFSTSLAGEQVTVTNMKTCQIFLECYQ